MLRDLNPKEVIGELLSLEKEVYRIQESFNNSGIFHEKVNFKTNTDAGKCIARLFHLPDEDLGTYCFDALFEQIYEVNEGCIPLDEAVDNIYSIIEDFQERMKNEHI